MSGPQYSLYLAVLPKYRSRCIDLLRDALGDELSVYASSAHLDKSVRTGIPEEYFTRVRMIRLLGNRAFIQLGNWREAIRATSLVVDLNPRSLNAWLFLALRSALRHRTLVWGHLYPQAGGESKTAWLRVLMRRMASGTILYTYEDLKRAEHDMPGRSVWVAPNSLYDRASITPQGSRSGKRLSALYVGRFERAKKVDLLIRGFAAFAARVPSAKLSLVGGGSEIAALHHLTAELKIADKVTFHGWIDDIERLKELYGQAFCSASPGFAGLGLTQSLGFGIPMIVARSEEHSPEIELAASGGVTWFESDDAVALANALSETWQVKDLLPNVTLSEYVAARYSAEAMALGLESALRNDGLEQMGAAVGKEQP